jgi:hypothetical protein
VPRGLLGDAKRQADYFTANNPNFLTPFLEGGLVTDYRNVLIN